MVPTLACECFSSERLVADLTQSKSNAGTTVVPDPNPHLGLELAPRRTCTNLMSGGSGSTADSRLTRPAVKGNRIGHGP